MAMSAHLATSVVVNSLGGGTAPPAAASAVQSPETLPDAIDYLDHHGGGEVTFASELSGHIIELTHVLPTIDEPVTIHGLGQNRLGVDGSQITAKSGWMVTIASGISGGVEISDLALTNRSASGVGGAIDAASDLKLRHVEVRGNVNGGGDGAGVDTTSPLIVEHSVISYNSASGDGAAIFAKSSDVKVSDSTFINNYGVHGAAIADLGGGALTVRGSTFTADFATGAGGAIYALGNSPSSPISVDVLDSTMVHNRGRFHGGAVDADNAALLVRGSTLLKNHARHGKGISQTGTGSLTLQDTILADLALRASDPRELDAGSNTTVSAAFSLVSDSTGTVITKAGGNIVGSSQSPVRPLLERLGYHGGPTMTMPPRPDSLAIDHGKGFGLTRDQRGRRRTVELGRPLPSGGDGTDIGAVEQQTTKPAWHVIRHRFGNQRVTLKVPSGYGCPAPREPFVIAFRSRTIRHPGAMSLTFKHAALWIGRGIRHTRSVGGSSQVIVHYRPNATSKVAHAKWPLVIRHPRRLGLRKLRLVLHYRRHYIAGGRERTRTITRTVHTKLNLC